jgi:GT2 family glycosyltransferase
LARVTTDGKHFAAGGARFRFAGVTYGTFAARPDGELYPDTGQVLRDFWDMAGHGLTVVRTYTPPPDDVVAAAADHDLRLLSDVFYPDWRYLVTSGRREQRRITRDACEAVAAATRRLAGCEQVLGLSLGNEIPADVIRWLGADVVERTLVELADEVRAIDPDMLVTYANYPTAEYLRLDTLDFITFNVFLEQQNDLRRYLTRLHNLAGDRPIVLGEVGLDSRGTAVGAARQAEVLDWQLETALERGVAGTCVFSWTDDWVVGGNRVDDWHFGLTAADRTPRPALDVVERWNRRTVADLEHPWPDISVVICAYNAEATIDECLAHTCALDYPNLDVVVVDDGSTDRTAELAARHPRARVVEIAHGGLSVARNAGLAAARHDLIAYLDSDAYPSPEWPYYLALGMNSHTVGAVGGPNVPPRDDPPGTHIVSRAPGGPVHVLVADDRAEHVPGCNMAFWRYALEEVGGFDPVFTAAGDDVDVCWKVLDKDLEIGFHPAALVWHHRRPTIRTYLRQQRGYGRSEALVESRHPDRYTALGTARWHGRIYNPAAPRSKRQAIYHGPFGTAAYQSVYGGGGHAIDVAHQLGAPVAVASLVTLVAAPLMPPVAVPGIVGALFLAILFAIGMVRADPPRHWEGSRLQFRATVAALHLVQPLVRLWGRHHRNGVTPMPHTAMPTLPQPVRRLRHGHLLFPAVRPRAELAGDVIAGLRTAGLRVLPVNAWDDVDATIVGSTLVVGELTTSAHPEGWQQLRITSRIRVRRVSGVAAAVAALTVLAWPLAVVAAVIGVAEIARGWSAVSRTAWRELLSGDRPVPDDPSAPPAAARTVLDLDREARRAGDVEEMVPR